MCYLRVKCLACPESNSIIIKATLYPICLTEPRYPKTSLPSRGGSKAQEFSKSKRFSLLPSTVSLMFMPIEVVWQVLATTSLDTLLRECIGIWVPHLYIAATTITDFLLPCIISSLHNDYFYVLLALVFLKIFLLIL